MFTVLPSTRPSMELYLAQPTYELLTTILDDRPVYIALPETDHIEGGPICAWVGDDYLGRETRNELDRNIPATVLLWALGAPRQPYAGLVAFTGVTESAMLGRVPASFDAMGRCFEVLSTLAFDLDRVLAGDPLPDTPDELRIQFVTDARLAAEMQYETMSMWTHDE